MGTIVKGSFLRTVKKAAEFAIDTTIYSKNQLLIEEDKLKMKVGDGVNVYANLKYTTVSPTEVQNLIADSSHTHLNKTVLDQINQDMVERMQQEAITPIANVKTTDDGAEIIITDYKGTTKAEIKNGKEVNTSYNEEEETIYIGGDGGYSELTQSERDQISKNKSNISDINNNLILYQENTPTNDTTKLWINKSDEDSIEVPDMNEFNELSDKVDTLKNNSLVKIQNCTLDFDLTYKLTTIPVLTITNKEYITNYDYLYFITEHHADYAFNGSTTLLNDQNISNNSSIKLWKWVTETINDKKYYKLTIDCSAIKNQLGDTEFKELKIITTNNITYWSGKEKIWLAYKYSEELFERDFINIEISKSFTYAVQDANKINTEIPQLNGKTVIFMGDSYTKGATNQFKALCEKYGATDDNRGIVSSSISGDLTGNLGFMPMWNRVNKLCDEYIANETTDNVGAIVFMGGANDGFGKSTWLGSGINDKNTNHIYGALHSIYRKFRDTFDCPIFTILQPYFPNGSKVKEDIDDETAIILGFENKEQALTFDTKEYCAYAMNKKQAIVKEMANFYNSTIVDCCFSWHSIFRESELEKFWSSNGHPTVLGYQEIADNLEISMLNCKWYKW